nr:hypothetical protein [Tanacetum cinerariifolium]
MVPPNNLGPDLAGKPDNKTSYRGMIGSLMYLTATRYDIQFSIVLCARYQSNPKKSHPIAMKRKLRYLKAEAEYVAAAGCCASLLWMKSQLNDYDIHYKMGIVVIFDPFPSTDEPEKRPLKEFLNKVLVLNGQRPLTLDFNTFYSSTRLNYNNGKYVDHPTPEVVKKELGKIVINLSYLEKTPVLENSFPVAWRILFTFVIQVLDRIYSSTKQVNSIHHLLAYSLITRTEVNIGEIIYNDLVNKQLNKSRLKYISHPRFISCALQVILGPDYTQDKKFRFLPPIMDLVSLPPLVAKLKKGKYQTVTSTSPKSQDLRLQYHSLRSEKGPYPKSHPLRPRDITFTTPDEGMAKTTLHLEGSRGDKDSGGNKPPDDMKPLNPTDADLSGTVNVEGENATHTATKEPSSHTEGETNANIQDNPEELKQSTDENIEFISSFTHLPSITQVQPITIIYPELSVPQREGKSIATDDQAKDQRKLVKASSIVRPDPDEPEEIKKAEEEARLNAISKTKVIKVIREEAKKLGIHPKEAITTKAGKLLKKAQKVQHETVNSRLKPEPITAFGISELDELREIIPKKKNTLVKDLMNSLSQRYERLRQIPRELGTQSALPALEQAQSQTSRRK